MKDMEFWDEDAILKDLLLQSNQSITEIASELGRSYQYVTARIKYLGLEWARKKNRKLSKGHAALTELIQQLLPGHEVVNEHHIGERLMLDVYCDDYKLGAEYHGRQHFFYSNHFHKDIYDFKQQQRRDERKMELCKEKGIGLVVFRFNDDLTIDTVYDRVLEAIKQAPDIEPEKKKSTFKGNHFYEKAKARQREYRKQQYQEYKRRKMNK